MNQPDFLIVGAARSGTTALYNYLKRHPSVFFSKVKEPCFYTFAGKKPSFKNGKFAFSITDLKSYENLFTASVVDQIKGDASTTYLFLYKETISNIFKYHPDPQHLKILIVLRDPVQRALSQYKWRLRDGRESMSFHNAIVYEAKRKKEGFSLDYLYAERSLYYNQVKAYINNFKDVKVILYDELKNYQKKTLSEINSFLGLEQLVEGGLHDEVNSSYIPKFPLLNKLITSESKLKFMLMSKLPDNWVSFLKVGLRKINSTDGDVIPEKRTLDLLYKYFSDDILKLETLIGKDLSIWKSHPANAKSK